MIERPLAGDRVVPQRRAGDRRRDVRARPDDPFRRLRGEPPVDSATAEDARVWIEVYVEMLTFWEHTAVQMGIWLDEVTSEHARQELREVDQRLIEDRCERLRRRLRLWRLRAQELAGREGGPAPSDASDRGMAPLWR